MITLTDTAAAKVKDLIDAEGETELALRVAVRPGGCSGFSYEMFFDTDVATDDLTADLRRRARSSSTRPAPSCSPAPRSTTRTACSRPASPSTTRTPSAPAAAARASPSRPASGGSAGSSGVVVDVRGPALDDDHFGAGGKLVRPCCRGASGQPRCRVEQHDRPVDRGARLAPQVGTRRKRAGCLDRSGLLERAVARDVVVDGVRARAARRSPPPPTPHASAPAPAGARR